jgi:5'-deoxy-5'-methylthioadenosine phosphorylase
MYAIIGGSGLAKLAGLDEVRREVVRTPYGDPSSPVVFGKLDGTPIVFLARHGHGHTLAPHVINYRANLWALQQVGASEILAVATVGGILPELGPGTLAVPDQLVDYTYGRRHTFFDGPDEPVTHVDFTHPYHDPLRQRLLSKARLLQLPVVEGGTYGCTQGPRLESAGEIRRMARDGCTLVGMTGMPEAALARELALPYATLAVVANHAAGVGSSSQSISMPDIGKVLDATMARVRVLLAAFVQA